MILRQFLHQRGLVVQAPGGVDQQHVRALRARAWSARRTRGRRQSELAGAERSPARRCAGPRSATARPRRRETCRPATSIARSPCSRYCCASLPMVVVLPVPLTPTTSTTCGLKRRSMTSGLATGRRMSAISSASACLTSSSVTSLAEAACGGRRRSPVRPLRCRGRRRSAVSSSSSSAASSRRRRVNTAPMPSRQLLRAARQALLEPGEETAERHQAGSASKLVVGSASRPSASVPTTRARSMVPGAASMRTGAKCSLWPAWSVSVRTMISRPSCAAKNAAAVARPACAQPRGAFAAQRLGHGGHARGRRARPFAVGEHVQERAFAAFARRSSVSCEHRRRSRSGNRRSGRRRWRCPGRNARARAITASASARKCRRFMRFRIRSLPACMDRCRCGISRGSSAISRHRSSSIAAGSSEDRRSRGKFRHQRQQAADHLARASARPAGRRRSR